jgi:hypothetical protein
MPCPALPVNQWPCFEDRSIELQSGVMVLSSGFFFEAFEKEEYYVTET